MLCPLCGSAGMRTFHVEVDREFLRCPVCSLVVLHPDRRPSLLTEVLRYCEHENSAADAGYATFLRRLADPLSERLPPHARGIDFGCGPEPVLAAMLSARGYPTVAYDPLFRPEEQLLDATYDFVSCSEVLEHVHAPADTLALIRRLLMRGGLFGVMTRLYDLEPPFATWWYHRDPTHVCFYSSATMQWLAARLRWGIAFAAPHITLFTVPGSGAGDSGPLHVHIEPTGQSCL